jgi:hypothetical protein
MLERSAMTGSTGIFAESCDDCPHEEYVGTAKVLADLSINGGGTYRADSLDAYKPDSGFAVGIGGVELPFESVTAEVLEVGLRDLAEQFGTTYVGTWHDEPEGIVFLDAVLICHDERSAWYAAIHNGQKAVYDFSKGEAVPTGSLQFDS